MVSCYMYFLWCGFYQILLFQHSRFILVKLFQILKWKLYGMDQFSSWGWLIWKRSPANNWTVSSCWQPSQLVNRMTTTAFLWSIITSPLPTSSTRTLSSLNDNLLHFLSSPFPTLFSAKEGLRWFINSSENSFPFIHFINY